MFAQISRAGRPRRIRPTPAPRGRAREGRAPLRAVPEAMTVGEPKMASPRGKSGAGYRSPVRAGAARSGPTGRGRRSAKAGDRSPFNYLAGGVLVAALIGFFALVLPHITPRDRDARPWSIDTDWDAKGTITLAPRGEFCRQMMIDNASGELHDRGLVRCGPDGATDGSAAAIDARFGAMRRSFNSR